MEPILIVLLHVLLVVAFTLRILLRDDLSPTSRLAWFIVITIVPVAGSLIYYLFGEIDLGKSANLRIRGILDEIRAQAGPALGDADILDSDVDPQYRSAFRYAASINGFNVVTGNSAELMSDARTARRRLIEDIDGAIDHVHVLYYIWLDDETGTNTANALIRAAKRGVTCRAMADGLGSRAMVKSALWRAMREAGVQVGVALPIDNPIRTIIKSRLDLRNHRKITIIDGRITYCGSQNCADPEFQVKAKYAPWVDIMLRVQGPVVAQNQLLFASDWMQYHESTLDEFPLETKSVDNGFPAQIMGDGPTERRGATPQLVTTLLQTAKSELIISTPYFVPDATLLEAICSAAHRGVKATLIFPKNNDSWVVAAASRSYYKKLLTAGVTIYEFGAGLLHSKTLTIDGKVTFLGSTNLDLSSFDLNYENNILLLDEGTTNFVRDRQHDYITQSSAVQLADVLSWPAHRRIWHNVIATIGPVL